MADQSSTETVVSTGADPIRVFISYSHDSRAQLDRVWELCERLRREGIDCRIDQHELNPAGGWPRWCMNQVVESRFVIVVCTETYKLKFDGKLRGGGNFEGFIITQQLYDEFETSDEFKSSKFVSVVFSPADCQFIPILLRGGARCDVTTDEGYELLYCILTEQFPNIGVVGEKRHVPRRSPVDSVGDVFKLQAQPLVNLKRRSAFKRSILRRHFLFIAGAALAAVLVSAGFTYRIFWSPGSDARMTHHPTGVAATIQITKIPPKGPGDAVNASEICGKISGADREEAQVVVYAGTNHWYVQPDLGSKIEISDHGTWCTKTHSGFRYAALLVKSDPQYKPDSVIDALPSRGGDILATTIVEGGPEGQ